MASSLAGLFEPSAIDDRIKILQEKKDNLSDEISKIVREVLEKDFPGYDYNELRANHPNEIQELERTIREEFIPKINKKIKHLEYLKADLQ